MVDDELAELQHHIRLKALLQRRAGVAQGDSEDLGHGEALNPPVFGLELRHSIRSLVEEAGRRSRGLGRLSTAVAVVDLVLLFLRVTGYPHVPVAG